MDYALSISISKFRTPGKIVQTCEERSWGFVLFINTFHFFEIYQLELVALTVSVVLIKPNKDML